MSDQAPGTYGLEIAMVNAVGVVPTADDGRADEELIELIEAAIIDTMDIDWQPKWAAVEVVKQLRKEGFLTTPPVSS